MLVVANGNFLFRAHGESYLLKRGVLTSVPAWVAEDTFFKALCADGKIAVSETTKDADVEKAINKAKAKKKK